MKKTLLAVFFVLLLFACKEEKAPEFNYTLRSISSNDFSECKGQACPGIQIDYLEFGDKGISRKIGQIMENRRARIFMDTEEDLPKTSLKEALRAFIAEFHDFQNNFPDFDADYEVRIKEEIVNRTDEILVIETKHYLYKGGAHGYGAVNLANFSLETGELLTAQDLFTNLDEFKAYAEKKFREKYGIPEGENINSTGFFFENDVFALPQNIGILEDEVVLIYNAYEVAAYAHGEMLLKFPKDEIPVKF